MKTTKSNPMYLVMAMDSILGSTGTSWTNAMKHTMRVFPTLEQALAYGKRAAAKVHKASIMHRHGESYTMRLGHVQIREISSTGQPKLLPNPYNL